MEKEETQLALGSSPISAAGVIDLPDTEKAAELIKKAEEYEVKQRSFLDEKKKKRGQKIEVPEVADQTQSPAEINEPIESSAEIGEESNAS